MFHFRSLKVLALIAGQFWPKFKKAINFIRLYRSDELLLVVNHAKSFSSLPIIY